VVMNALCDGYSGGKKYLIQTADGGHCLVKMLVSLDGREVTRVYLGGF
jgi:hypothetical protein